LHAAIDVNLGNTELVARLGTDRPARALGEDDQLPVAPHPLARQRRHPRHRAHAGAAIDRNHLRLQQEQAEQRNPRQLALEDEQRLPEQRQ
jgi:hypothetical protein